MDYALLFNRFGDAKGASVGSRQRQLHECLRGAICNGTLAAGTRLPASRTLAQELGLARNTVLYAYDQLATEGFVLPDRRGTVVAEVAALAAAPLARNALPLRVGLSRRAMAVPTREAPETPVPFAPGVPALEEFPVTLWRRLLDRAWRSLRTEQLNYAAPTGEPVLREAIANHLRVARGALLDSSQVIITDGTQSSLDLCARVFADAGDKAWVESPGYQGALSAFKAAQLKPMGMVVDSEGIAPTASDWQRHPPKLIYVTPSHQYPTGSVLSLTRRLALIEQARAASALIIEDDYDSEFRHEGPPLACMQGLAPDAPVVYLGTFSKTMFPALRIGFMVVPAALMSPLSALLARTTPRGRAADQLALAEFMQSGQFSVHLRRMRRLYRQRRDALVAALERQLGDVADVYGGSAGMHLALRLRNPRADDAGISRALQARGIVAPALSEQAIGKRVQPWRGLLLGYAQVPVEQMPALVKGLDAVVRRWG
ncbi:DNA-binding protein [Hydrogenophaga crassostreae]|uniref:DNA-binding protein n=1 Tax=Hydrogenophaga crassostreae TaxID=1763535 RepID=A0A167H6T9_9BURK|nr:PLP-dependent aminotransferase family protein [Hydrogenophaga crassostreae]AOW12534.1 DNA-binding protein [Hydrogenophaga crassostreae]OAD40402.1 DNA-binding protein [Hydrogenophaga crassostreae]